MRVKDLKVYGGQYAQSNIALTYYDESHTRFQSARFADARMQLNEGTSDGWFVDEWVFHLPPGTGYVVVHCVLGMSGEIWFDDLSLDIPVGLPWQKQEGEVFTHYWLPGSGYPEGSIEYQQQLYEHYSQTLGIPREAWRPIAYYLYPDTARIQQTLGITGVSQVNYDTRQIHSINSADNHEIIHLLTDPYGRLPRVLGEGAAYYLIDDLEGEPIQPLAQKILLDGRMPPLSRIVDPIASVSLDPIVAIATGASFVGYLLEFGGTERFLELHRQCSALTESTPFSVAFENAYGGSLEEAEGVWRRMLSTADFSQFEESETEP